MTKKEYLERSESIAAQVFALAREAEQIVVDMIPEGVTLDKEALYGDTDDPDYIYIQNDNEVVIGIENYKGSIFVTYKVFDNDDEDCTEILYEELNAIDQLEIADYLAKM